jgi:hypothetical protein
MKKLFLLFLLILKNHPSEAQMNLVPNPSFEDTVYCPFGLDQLNAAIGWSSYRNSPDYFNGCNNFNGIGTPNTSFGFQYAHSGQAYIGLITYRKYNSSSGYNYREFAGAALNIPLQLGVKYFFSFYVVAAEKISGYLSNNIGLRFFNLSFSNLNPAPIDNFSHFKIDTILTDSLNWYKFSGSFIADSNYSHICIGNFYDYLSTDTISFNSTPDYAYYFVDDVCVTTDSLYNETWTGLSNFEQNEVNVWPNPVQDYFQFKSSQIIDEINIYDICGKLLKSERVNLLEGRINLGMISRGIYIASFKKENNISVYKFFKL